MGARTPHELMRCAEVTFIRDCAEMAARSSLARTESRCGLYHDRVDHPQRDDTTWFHHLDLHKSPSGSMEFTARPVAPYLIPVEGFSPVGGPSRVLGEIHAEDVATAGARDVAPVSGTSEAQEAQEARETPETPETPETSENSEPSENSGRAHAPLPGSTAESSPGTSSPHSPETSSARLLELVALADEQPELTTLQPYLTDPAPAVRREAVAVLTETLPTGTGPALAAALRDPHSDVRTTAAASLRELVETLPPDAALRDGLAEALVEADPVVRAAALDFLRALRLSDAELFAHALSDPDTAVRIEAVRALVSVDAADSLAQAAGDPSREVRVTVAKALAGVDAGHPVRAVLHKLTEDADPLVRGAAFGSLASAACPAQLSARAVEALDDGAWQVRAGAATALATADPAVTVRALTGALADLNADVRKAAVLSLTRHTTDKDARVALTTATKDSDADVRAYASRAL